MVIYGSTREIMHLWLLAVSVKLQSILKRIWSNLVHWSGNLLTKLDQGYRDFDLTTKGGIILNPKVDKIKDTIQLNNKRRNAKNLSSRSYNPSYNVEKKGQVLVTSICPTSICTKCSQRYRDSLNLGILIICDCVCHKAEK